MGTTSLTVDVTGTVEVKPPAVTTEQANTNCIFQFGLLDEHKCPDAENSSGLFKLNSSAVFVPLPTQSTLEGRFLFIDVGANNVDVEVTHTTQGITIYPVRGVLVLEVPEDERITLVRVQGVADIRFVFTGKIP
jgi:hypothetical protein